MSRVLRFRRGVAAALLVLALASTAAACGGGDNDHGSAPKSGQNGKPSAQSWVGLTKREAIAKAEAEDRPSRITREDDETFLVTQDYNPERVNFEIDNGKVTKATYG